MIPFSIKNWIARINSSSDEFPSTQTPVVNLIRYEMLEGIISTATLELEFSRVLPLSEKHSFADKKFWLIVPESLIIPEQIRFSKEL